MDISIYNFGDELDEQTAYFLSTTLQQHRGEPCQVRILAPLPMKTPTIGALLEAVSFKNQGPSHTFYVLVPSDPVVAATLVAEMYRRAGRFPILLRISTVAQGEARQTKVEVIDPTPRRT